MTQKVLFVDDDPKILKGVSRHLEDVFDVTTAEGPTEALRLFDEGYQCAVVVSDMRMPGMSGAELLANICQRSPDTVRIMLTGFADLESTIQAVNEGHIYRFLSKPCSPQLLERAIRDGLKQYELVTAEKTLLEGTLHGSVKVLSEMLSLVNPMAFGRTSQVQRIALAIGKQLNLSSTWNLKIASLLFPLGCITVSESALDAVFHGRPVPKEELDAFEHHAQLAQNMLQNIPRLEGVAEIIAYQDKGFDGSGLPRERHLEGQEIPVGARVLKVASDFEIACKNAFDTSSAVALLEEHSERYDPEVLEGLRAALRSGLCQADSREVTTEKLRPGMILATDVRGTGGQLIVAKGQTLSESTLRRLSHMSKKGVVHNKFEIEVLGELDPASETVATTN